MRDPEASRTEPSVQLGAQVDRGAPLPMAHERHERKDAAANRRRIMEAAQTLLSKRGLDGLTMQAVATEAGVGKGTVSHRFGDRDGLLGALVDEDMREFQDLFLHGPPPLGPGAAPQSRLEAFFEELIRRVCRKRRACRCP